MINGVQTPDADLRGRAFPYKDTGPHFVGPALIRGELFEMKVWKNVAPNGREYLRVVFDVPSQEEE